MSMTDFSIRESGPHDWEALQALYPSAFPDEDLLPLMRDLLDDPSRPLSLVATRGDAVIGHVLFTECRLPDAAEKPVLLGPLAVLAGAQRQGVGSALVEEGLTRMRAAGATQAFVLGDPTYYGRFGFAVEEQVAPPYPLPAEWRVAWRSKRLAPSLAAASAAPQGVLQTPAPWNRRALWAP